MTSQRTEDVPPEDSQELSEWAQARRASTMTVDFAKAQSIRQKPSGVLRDGGTGEDTRPRSADGKLLTPKQIRARARRRVARGHSSRKPALTKQEFEALYKPIDEWDLEELARGRPRDPNGTFTGRSPSWVTREVYEKSMERFQQAIKTRMGEQSITALDTLYYILNNEEVDNRGKPLIPASVKLQASTFLLEHVVGKPKQHVQQDISVKLQGILGAVMANPNEALASPDQGGRLGYAEDNQPGYNLAHFPGVTIPFEVTQGEVIDDDEDLDSGDE